MKRRSFLASLPLLPLATAVRPCGHNMSAGQPLPIDFQFGRLEGVTTIVRIWNAGDPKRCRLCPECTASRHGSIEVCSIMTEERVSEEDVPVYDSRHLDFGPEERTERPEYDWGAILEVVTPMPRPPGIDRR